MKIPFNLNLQRVKLKVSLLLIITCAALPPTLFASDEAGGQMEANLDGKTIAFPVLKSDFSVDIQGDLATVTVVQSFANPLQRPVNASYLFPLNKDAAVYEMEMDVGAEHIIAQIQEKQQALKTFNQAKAEGKSAALLNQHRPNMFTQDIANLMPNLPIKVTLKYVQIVPQVDAHYELVLPLVVGPRYQPAGAGQAPQSVIDDSPQPSPDKKITTVGKWQLEALPAYPPTAGVDAPKAIESDRVSIAISLHAGMPINSAHSDTHSLVTRKTSLEDWDFNLENGRTIDNRDFVLQYRLSGSQSQAGLLAYKDERGGFFSLLVEPPEVPASQDISRREMVFVLDCSGSMDGLPMDASKAFMREALKNLRRNDSFRIIRFSDTATEFSDEPLPATADNIRAGLNYTKQLQGMGGTEMLSGIQKALSPNPSNNVMRIIVFLTDGYIGNEASILSYINSNIGNSRIYAFGVGTSVNRYLLSEVAHTGRGFVRYMDPTENIHDAAKALAGRLQSPVLTDISIDWGKLSPTAVNPNPIPDLFAGQSLRLMGRYQQAGNFTIRVHGYVNGRKATLPLSISLPKHSTHGEAIALIWARSKVKRLMDEMLVSQWDRRSGLNDTKIQQAVTDIGLRFKLVTQWTSFVAVTERIYNSSPETTENTQVPLPMVKGVNVSAYGERTSQSSSYSANPSFSFHGNSAPEPGKIVSMLLLALLFAIWMYRSRPTETV